MTQSDLADDIVPSHMPHHTVAATTLRTDFKPWHRVRKQYIREKQWNHEIRFLVKQLRRKLQDTETEWGEGTATVGAATPQTIPETIRVERPLRCFVLPGDDLLDIRSLWKSLEDEGCFLRFLGFNSTLSTEERMQQMAITENAVTQLTKVCKDSHVTEDRFQSIARNNTQAYRLFRNYGPYDVVNLDLCDSLVPRSAAEASENYTALHQLLIYQIEHQTTPWLLFTTTQVDRDNADQNEVSRLATSLRENCEQHADFASALAARLPKESFLSAHHKIDISQLSASALTEAFGVILGKWLVKTLASASPRCGVKLLRSYRYVIKPDTGVEMLSLGFRITPFYARPIDSSGMSELRPESRHFPSELESALEFVNVASQIADVDQLLARDAALHHQLAEAKADMLSAAGYDRDAYLRWVMAGEQG